MILVTGGTGRVGRVLVEHLLEYEVPFRVLTRNPGLAGRLWPEQDVEAIKGDFEDPRSMKKALAGVDTLFLLSPADIRLESIQCSAVQAAADAGVRHVVKLSAMGASSMSPIRLCRMHRKVEQLIESSDMTWTHLRPNFFYQSILRHRTTVRSERRIYASAGNGRASMIDARDVGLAAAVVLADEGHARKTYELTGKEPISHADIAKTISRVTGRTITYHNVSAREIRARMLEKDVPEWLVEDRIGLYRFWANNDASLVTSTLFSLTRKSPFTFRQWVNDHEDAFLPMNGFEAD